MSSLWISVLDFKKAHDLIDWNWTELLISVLEEFRIDWKMREIIQQQKITDTVSKVKFHGIFQSPFAIKRSQAGRWTVINYINVSLEKLKWTWKKAIKENRIKGIGGICLGWKRHGLKLECLAFADGLPLLTEDKEEI